LLMKDLKIGDILIVQMMIYKLAMKVIEFKRGELVLEVLVDYDDRGSGNWEGNVLGIGLLDTSQDWRKATRAEIEELTVDCL